MIAAYYWEATGEVFSVLQGPDLEGFPAAPQGAMALLLSDPVDLPGYVLDGSFVQMPAQPSRAHSWNWATKQWESTAQSVADYTESLRAECMSHIDKAAESARLRYMTGGAGQEATYIRKDEQARAWQSASFAGPAPSFIAAEADALGVSAQALALQIIQLADFWGNVKGPQIEAARRKWKVAIANAAADLEAITAARDAGIAELGAL